MTRFAFVLPCVLACSSSPVSQNDVAIDAAIPQKDAAINDVSIDAPVDPLVPHPPEGSTKCGSGAIDSSSAQKTCTEPSWILDDMMQMDGGFAPMPRACNALTIGAGEWQVCASPSTPAR